MSAIVLNDIGPELDPAGIARIQGYVGLSAAMTSWDDAAARCAAINTGAFPDFNPPDWLAFARRTCREQGDGSIAFAYDPAISQSIAGDAPQTVPPDLWPVWDALADKPVMVVRGALSDLLSARTANTMAERHRGPFELVEVPRVGHAPILDEPIALAAIETFLARHAN